MASKLTPYDDRQCPIYGKVIDGELCYETALCMQGQFKLSSVPESTEIICDINTAREMCVDCPHGDME